MKISECIGFANIAKRDQNLVYLGTRNSSSTVLELELPNGFRMDFQVLVVLTTCLSIFHLLAWTLRETSVVVEAAVAGMVERVAFMVTVILALEAEGEVLAIYLTQQATQAILQENLSAQVIIFPMLVCINIQLDAPHQQQLLHIQSVLQVLALMLPTLPTQEMATRRSHISERQFDHDDHRKKTRGSLICS